MWNVTLRDGIVWVKGPGTMISLQFPLSDEAIIALLWDVPRPVVEKAEALLHEYQKAA